MNGDKRLFSFKRAFAVMAPVALLSLSAASTSAGEIYADQGLMAARALPATAVASTNLSSGVQPLQMAQAQMAQAQMAQAQMAQAQMAQTQMAQTQMAQTQMAQPQAVQTQALQALAQPNQALQPQQVPAQAVVTQVPASSSPTSQATKKGDPVYDAWEEFLKQRSGKGPEIAQDTAALTKIQPTSPLTSITQGGFGGAGSMGGLLAAVFGGMGLAGAFLARKKGVGLGSWLKRQTASKRERNRVRVVSVNPLSAQGSIAVVEVFDQVLVLGVTSGRVSLLTRMNQDGSPAPVVQEEAPVETTSSLFKDASASTGRGKAAGDFSALLNNLARESESPAPDPQSPLARYAAMSGARREAAIEPPPEDMAGQVLRKMRTMKRFRSAA